MKKNPLMGGIISATAMAFICKGQQHNENQKTAL
jgi:hypothetical protein